MLYCHMILHGLPLNNRDILLVKAACGRGSPLHGLATTLINAHFDTRLRLYTRLVKTPRKPMHANGSLKRYELKPPKRLCNCKAHLDLTHSSPLPGAPGNHTRPTTPRPIVASPPATLFLLIQNQLQHIIRELRELETHGLELWLRIVAQAVTPCRPERSHGLADGLIVGIGLLVDEPCVGELSLGGGCCAVDLGVCEGSEFGQAEALGESVHAGVHEEASAVVVGDGLARVFFEGSVARGGGLLGEVFACVEVFDYGAHCVDVAVRVGDLTRLEDVNVRSSSCRMRSTYSSWCKALHLLSELWRLEDDCLVGRVCGLCFSTSNKNLDDRALHQTEPLSVVSPSRVHQSLVCNSASVVRATSRI